MSGNLIGFVMTVFLLVFACTKENNCKQVTVTNDAPGCEGWGIVADSRKYPSRNIPDQFKQDGLQVCAVYSIYDDLAMCICCGGKWADIKSMKASK